MIARSAAAAILVALAASCPGGGPPKDPKNPQGSGSTQPPIDAPPATAATNPDERECHALVAHAVTVEVARLRQAKPPGQMPTDAEIATVTAELQADPACRTLSRAAYDCAMAAKTLAEIEGCYSTRKSSTSNSSVAPGGITPAAPRSP
jgi:hypothetical protein